MENNTWKFPVSTDFRFRRCVAGYAVVLKHSNWSLWREGPIVHFSCFTAIQESKEHEIDEGFADVIEKGWLIKEGANDDSRRKRQVINFNIIFAFL